MEPQANNPNQAPEKSPEELSTNPESLTTPEAGRKLEGVPIGALEHLGGSESHERSTGVANKGPQADASVTVLPIALPADQTVAQDDAMSTTPDPTIAADDDVIEKEWVDKAKKVITQTKGDPYAKEREVSKLQANYMQKRYGKQVKIPDET